MDRAPSHPPAIGGMTATTSPARTAVSSPSSNAMLRPLTSTVTSGRNAPGEANTPLDLSAVSQTCVSSPPTLTAASEGTARSPVANSFLVVPKKRTVMPGQETSRVRPPHRGPHGRRAALPLTRILIRVHVRDRSRLAQPDALGFALAVVALRADPSHLVVVGVAEGTGVHAGLASDASVTVDEHPQLVLLPVARRRRTGARARGRLAVIAGEGHEDVVARLVYAYVRPLKIGFAGVGQSAADHAEQASCALLLGDHQHAAVHVIHHQGGRTPPHRSTAADVELAIRPVCTAVEAPSRRSRARPGEG